MATSAVTSVEKRPYTALEKGLFLDQFARSLRAENKSPATVYTYVSGAAQFAEHLQDKGMPTQVTSLSREHVESFIEHLLATSKPATANNRYRALQAYFRWLLEEGEIKQSPMANMRPPRIPEAPPEVLSQRDIEQLFRACSGTAFADRREVAPPRPVAGVYYYRLGGAIQPTPPRPRNI